MVATNWLPGAIVVPSSNDGGSMLGGNAYATWHTFEANPNTLSATGGAKYLISTGNEVTLVFNPVTGQTAQLIAGNRASRGLRNLSGGVQTNRAGRVHIQIEVIGYAGTPWTKTLTAAGRAGLARILAWLDSWGIPRSAPAGNPKGSYAGPHNRIAPAGSGHYTHSQWKENDHWDHGAVLWTDIFAVLPVGKPAPAKPPNPAPVVPAPDPRTYLRVDVAALQRNLRLTGDGVWGPTTDRVALNFRNAAYPVGRYDIRTVQKAVGVTADGIMGPATQAAIINETKSLQKVLRLRVDGDWGPATDKAFLDIRSEYNGK